MYLYIQFTAVSNGKELSDSKPPATFILFHNSEITITAAYYQLIKI